MNSLFLIKKVKNIKLKILNILMKIEVLTIDNQDYTILIGRDAKDNENIIKMSGPEDLWMHFQSVSGPHIILQSGGNDIPKKYLHQVASKLFEYKPKVPKNEFIIYTEIKNVKLTKTLGSVITKNIRVLKLH
jgi:predicted ribosome quality control (RQC) complex YloA/Tae2 family protein